MQRVMTLCLVALLGLAPWSLSGEKSQTPKLSDNEFLQKASTGHNAAIHFGKIAENRSKNVAVRDFSTQLVKDHQAAYTELGKLLTTRKVGVIAGLEKECRDDAKRLLEANVDDFDALYVGMMVRHHDKCLPIFTAHGENGEQADVRDYAKRTLRVMRNHQDDAKKIQANLVR